MEIGSQTGVDTIFGEFRGGRASPEKGHAGRFVHHRQDCPPGEGTRLSPDECVREA